MAKNDSNVIRIVGLVDPPFITPCFKDFPHKCPDPGIEIMFLYCQLIAYGYEVSFMEADDDTAAYKLLAEGFADISGFADTLKNQNPALKDLRTTMPLYEDHVIAYHKDRKDFDPPNLLFNHCPYSVWLFVLFTLITAMLFRIGYKFLHTKLYTESLKTSRFLSPEFPLLGWNFCVVIFLSIYSQYLGITLSTQFTSMEVPVSDITSLLKVLKSGECKLVMNERNIENLFELFSEMNDDTNMTQDLHVSYVFDNDEDVVQMIKQPGCYFGMELETSFIHMNAQFGGLKAIHFYDMPIITFFYFYRKNHPFKTLFEVINGGSSHSKYYRYLEIAINKMYFKHKLKHRDEFTSTTKSLSLAQLASGFWVLVIGLFISVLLFCVTKFTEIVTKMVHKRQIMR